MLTSLDYPNLSSFRRVEAKAPVVGATSAVGVALLHCLEQRGFPLGRLKLLASVRSARRTMRFQGEDLMVEILTEASFEGVDIALFSAGSGVAKQFAPAAVKAGAIVVDNSSVFRMDPNVPLIVPEVNAASMAGRRGIIANPNCVAVIATVALAPLHRAHPIRHLTSATYQAASGGGAAMVEELRDATTAYLAGEAFTPSVLPHDYAFNLFSHNSDMDLDSGYNGEELKVVAETRRILGAPKLPVSITCIRVPVLRAHANGADGGPPRGCPRRGGPHHPRPGARPAPGG